MQRSRHDREIQHEKSLDFFVMFGYNGLVVTLCDR